MQAIHKLSARANEQIGQLRTLTSLYTSNTSLEQQRTLEQQNKALSGQVYQALEQMHRHFKEFEEGLELCRREDRQELRIRETQRAGLLELITQTVSATKEATESFRVQVAAQAERQLTILDPDLAPETKLTLLQSQQLLTEKVLEKTLGKASLKLMYRVEDINDKKREMQRLEMAVQSAKQMLTEIAFLVQ